MKKTCKIDSWFKKKTNTIENASTSDAPTTSDVLPITEVPRAPETLASDDPPRKFRRINEVDITSLERDPGLRPSIWDYSANLQDEIRRAYIKLGPYQPILQKYPKSGAASHQRCFQESYFKLYPSWLEYSPHKDAVFCLPCYLFSPPSGNSGQNAFISEGFRNWRRVSVSGETCLFKQHIGRKVNAFHKICQAKCDALMNQSTHIVPAFEGFTSQQKASNRLRVKATVDTIRWLVFQGVALRGHDESIDSTNRGNLHEMLGLLRLYNEEVDAAVLSAPRNAQYNSHSIQKEIIHCFASRVKKTIREEIGDAKFCLLVDEARDVSNKEQMSLVLRFVDKCGFVKERFFGLVHVPNTTAAILKGAIYSILSNHTLDVNNIRGQGYDGASNMRGEWNGLQALVSRDCPYAYYVHCFAHRLQLALVGASRQVDPVFDFFVTLNLIVNITTSSTKRCDELKSAQASDIEHLISIDMLETGSGLNQIGVLQRPGDTRWSSHYKSVCSLLRMFSATCQVLIDIKNDGSTLSQRGEARTAYRSLISFEFIFILHMMEKIMEITNFLCVTLQSQSQDILNAMHVVSSTKEFLQKLRDESFDSILTKAGAFCLARNIDVPNMEALYLAREGRARHQHENFTIGHYYRINIFYAAIDSQLQELNTRFNEKAMELLMLSSSLDPRVGHVKIDDVCELVHKFYPQDFTEQEKAEFEVQLRFYEHGVVQLAEYKELSSVSELCQWLVRTKKSTIYPLVFRVIVLILTLPVSTATSERSFSAMKVLKTRLRSKMEDNFLSDSLLMYIEREIADSFSTNSIVDDFRDMKERRVPF